MWIGVLWAGLRVSMLITHVGGKFRNWPARKSLAKVFVLIFLGYHTILKYHAICCKIGREREKGQIGKIPEESPDKSGKSWKNRQNSSGA